jgi:thiamine-phosphate pyrophosphorylase
MLRLMDANLDRLSEGLRVLEDVSRFILGDARTTETLKRLRHELTSTDPKFKNKLLAARDSENDIGRESPVKGIKRKHISDLVTANAKRAQEALRVLEEFAKLPEIPSDIQSRNFEQARFTLYEIERALIMQLSRQDKRDRINGLYIIIDAEKLTGWSVTEATQQVVEGGASVVQFRSKHANKRDLIAAASEMKGICARAGVLFIMNDHIDVALAIDADGVHLGQNDIPVSLAREMLPPNRIIGCSVRTVEKAIQAQEKGADYLGVGAIYPSPTKSDAEVIGPGKLREIRNATALPVVAIGGINEGNAREAIEHGADCLAVISAVLNTEDIEAATHRLAAKISQGE